MWVLRSVTLALAVFVTACGDNAPTPAAPTPTPSQTQTQTPTPTPTARFDLSPFVGVWDLTLRLTEVRNEAGGGCVAETLESQMGVPRRYSLTITADDVALTDLSRDWTATFTSFKTDEGGFTTAGAPGSFTVSSPWMDFGCNDGTTDRLWAWAEGITGELSGTELSGTWGAMFERLSNEGIVHVSAEFTGRRR
jgi:hypothetical protein